MRYYDVFGEGGFHSAFMTTYSFGAQAFEAVPFWRLRGTGCNNITVLADAVMFNQEMADFGAAQFAGSSYHVVKVHQGGAFHPKITLLLGEKKGRLLVGSANLTSAGLGGNRELVVDTRYNPEEELSANLFGQAMAYIQSKVPADDPWFWAALNRAERRTPWLEANMPVLTGEGGLNGEKLILDVPSGSILHQIESAIEGDPIRRITVMSPYWDYRLKALKALSQAFGSPPIDVLIDTAEGAFPAEELEGMGNVRVFDHDKLGSSRLVHAKLFLFHGEAADHVVSGSINCSAPAMLDEAAKNSEAGIYSRIERGRALETLGLEEVLRSPVDPASLPSFLPPGSGVEEMKERYRDGGELVRRDDALEWKPPLGTAVQPVSLTLFARNGQQVGEPRVLEDLCKKRWSLSNEGERPHYGVVTFSDETSSAPVPVIDLSLLPKTTTSSGSGKRNKIVDSLLDLHLEDLTLFEALAQLEALERDAGEPTKLPRARSPREQEADTRRAGRQRLSYEEFIKRREELASKAGSDDGSMMASFSDRPADMVSECLNRLIGLVSQGELDSEIAALEEREKGPETPSEGKEDDDGDSGGGDPPGTASENTTVTATLVRPARPRTVQVAILQAQRDHAEKIKRAVDAYEKHCRSLLEKPVDTSELVRLRVLLQVVLRYAKPAEGEALPHQVLSIYGSNMMGWPRLVGRLLIQHFGRSQLIRRLELTGDDVEQKRIVEYLATSTWAAKAALFALENVGQAGPVSATLEKILIDLQSLSRGFVKSNDSDRTYFELILSRLDENFGLPINYLVTEEESDSIFGISAEQRTENVGK